MVGSRWFAVTLGLALGGCNPSDSGPAFGTGGSRYESDGSDDTGSSGDDTGSVDPDAPVITEIDAHFEDYGRYGIVVELNVSYTDANDDVQGGILAGAIEEVESGDLVERDINIDGTDAYIEEGVITAAIPGLDSDLEYVLTVQVIDSAGNGSEVSTAQIEAYAGR